ncbi:MAG: glycosyltransferase family 1 protein [Lachnospiraceae bacterium]|nr:glycosyltransferase family 1 protein [Lachnospiraceae bacterium]
MDWQTQYEITLTKALEAGDLASARALTRSFHLTGTAQTARTCYLEAALSYYEGHYPLALFWADKGFLLDPSFLPLHELLGLLREYQGDFSEYVPAFSFDVSSDNRPLRIILVEGPIKIVNYTAEQFRKNFEALGHEVFVFYMEEMTKDASSFWAFCKKGIDFCLTFNNMALSQKLEKGDFLWDALHIPCFDYMFDHPLYFFDTFDDPPASAVVTCVDRHHVSYVKRFYPKVNNCFFFPLGSEELFREEIIPWQERSIQALYVGSLKKNPHAVEDAFSRKVVNLLCEHTGLTVEEAVEQLLGPTDETTLKKTLERYRYCDLNTNFIFRENLVRVLVNANIHVTVYGSGWEECDFSDSPFFHHEGSATQEECIRKMQDTRFVLNSMPWFKDGTHDRIYNAMLAHALCITDPSDYLAEEFTDREDILYYSLDAMEKLPDLIHYYEAHPEEAVTIIEKGYQKAVLSHTWQNRSIELLERFFQKKYE